MLLSRSVVKTSGLRPEPRPSLESSLAMVAAGAWGSPVNDSRKRIASRGRTQAKSACILPLLTMSGDCRRPGSPKPKAKL